jgi:hypothetical protein
MFDVFLQPNQFWYRAGKKAEKGQFVEAIVDTDRAIRGGFSFSFVYLFRAGCNFNLKEYEEGISDCKKCLSICLCVDFNDAIGAFFLLAIGHAIMNNRNEVTRNCQCIVDYHELFVNVCKELPHLKEHSETITFALGVAKKVLRGELSVEQLQRSFPGR